MPESSYPWCHRRATQRPSISPRRPVRADREEIDRGRRPGRTCCPVTAHRDSFILDWLTQVAVGLLGRGRDSPARVSSQADRSTRRFLRAHITLWHGEVAPLSSAFLARAKTLLAVRAHSRRFDVNGEWGAEAEEERDRDRRYRKSFRFLLPFSSLELVSASRLATPEKTASE